MSQRRSSLGCTSVMGGMLVVAMVATLAGQVAGPGVARGGVSDVARDGRRMAYLLLERVGLEPAVWTGDPLELAESGVEVLWLPELPMGFRALPTLSPEEDPFGMVPDEEPIDHRVLRGLELFLERGGDLVLPARGDGCLDMAERLLGLEPDALAEFLVVESSFAEGDLETGLRERGVDGGILDVDGEDELDFWDSDSGAAWVSVGGDPPDAVEVELLPALDLADLEDVWSKEEVFAVSLRADAGRVVLLSEDDFWTNLSMPAADNALALVRLVEHLDRRVWFDETVLLGHSGSWLGYLLRPPLWPLTLAALALACLAAWRTAPRRGFPMEERLEATPAPLERARGRAGLLLRAGRPELLAADLVAGVRTRLGDDDAALERLLRAVAPPDGRDPWLARARRALGLDGAEHTPKTTAGLEELGATLAAIETRIQES